MNIPKVKSSIVIYFATIQCNIKWSRQPNLKFYNLPCIAYLLSTINCDKAQKASSSSIKYISKSAAIWDIPENLKGQGKLRYVFSSWVPSLKTLIYHSTIKFYVFALTLAIPNFTIVN